MSQAWSAISQATQWTVGFVTGMINRVIREQSAPGEHLPLLQPDEPFRELRDALLGRDRRQIALALGVPPTACVGFANPSQSAGQRPFTFWDATTWYYPFDQRDRKAIAIKFVGDQAREVEFIAAAA